MTSSPEKTATKTSYQVLKFVHFDDTDTWMLAGDAVDATNATEAIRARADAKGGTYVAVPARSWKPVTVTVETRTSLKIG